MVCAFDRDALVGDAGDGFVMIMKSFQWERLCMAIAAVAGAAASLERVAEWSTTQPAATTQPAGQPDVRWWELAREVAATRALAYAALVDVVAGRDVVPAVSAAKLLACDLAVAAADYLLTKASAISEAEANGPNVRCATRGSARSAEERVRSWPSSSPARSLWREGQGVNGRA